jgi:hypothetical protein
MPLDIFEPGGNNIGPPGKASASSDAKRLHPVLQL